MAASLPAAEATDFPPDGLISLRFSKPLTVASANEASIVLFGPGGVVPANVVPSQDGMLVFVLPRQMLFPGTRYTLFVDGVVSTLGEHLQLQTFGFDTARRRH